MIAKKKTPEENIESCLIGLGLYKNSVAGDFVQYFQLSIAHLHRLRDKTQQLKYLDDYEEWQR